MNQRKEFSNNTEKYLSCFHEILNDMIIGMTNAPLTDSISHNFIAQMIPHHMAAIEMSHNILQYTTFIPLQNIAANIIAEQTKSIENMKNIKEICSCMENTENDLYLYQKNFHQITQVMFSNMKNACTTNNINANFMREMIPHHKGAIQMSNNTLQFPICPELKPILQAIITSQRAGVRKMEYLLHCM